MKHKEVDAHRGNAAERGYDGRWQKARAAHLKQHPLCVDCAADGTVAAGNIVDHIVDHKGDQDLFWDQDNWQTLCKRHHDAKTWRTHAKVHGGSGPGLAPPGGSKKLGPVRY